MPRFPRNDVGLVLYVKDGNNVEYEVPHVAFAQPVPPVRALEETEVQGEVIGLLPGSRPLGKGSVTVLWTTPNPTDRSLPEILADDTIVGVNAQVARPVPSTHKLLHLKIRRRADFNGQATTEQWLYGCHFAPPENVSQDSKGDRVEYSITVCGEFGTEGPITA